MQAFLISKSYHLILLQSRVFEYPALWICGLWLWSHQLVSRLHQCISNAGINHSFAACSIFPVTKLINCDDSPSTTEKAEQKHHLSVTLKMCMGLLLQENAWTTKHQGTEGPMQRALAISYSCRNRDSTTILLPKGTHLAWVQGSKGGRAWMALLYNPSCTGNVTCQGAAGRNLPLGCTAQRSCGC